MNARLVFEVARWELLRFFKLKEQLMALATFLAIGLGVYGVTLVVTRSQSARLQIAVIGAGQLPPADGFDWLPGIGLPEARERIARRDLDGALILAGDGSAELLVRRTPTWLSELQAVLDRRWRRLRMADAGVAPEVLERVLSTAPIELATLDPSPPAGRGAAIAASVAVGLMLLGVLLGNAYLLIGITGEKQLRMTEQVVAAISPQTWIDGKILGLSAMTLLLLTLYVLPSMLLMQVLRWLGAAVPDLPAAAVDPFFLAALVVFSSLGFLLWFTFFAAIAATVDDPNNSSRGGWMLVPLLPLGLAFATIRDPDALMARVLGLLPPTAPAVMPVRMLLTRVPIWELLVAAAGLAAAIWLLRRAAGRIFHLGILMYGKEPTWREIRRWARETA
jgi:ABC-2 type transport system permease protein